MAQRRMTSLEVTSTDAFLDMPQSSQLLYFHLNSLADDDGFVANPKSVMRNCGSQADDLKLLIAKKFVIAFEDGVCVIKHWRINNFIRKDIYKETKYLDLKRSLFIRPNGAYTLNDDGQTMAIPKGHFNLEDVNDTLTKRQLRLGKVRLGKVNKETPLPNWLNKEAWNAWLTYKKERNKPMTPLMIKLHLKKLEVNQKDHVHIIKNSIENGWTGLFPLKENDKSDYAIAHQKRISTHEEESEREENAKRNDKVREITEASKKLADKMKM